MTDLGSAPEQRAPEVREDTFTTVSQGFLRARPPRMKPWWCDCDSGEGSDGYHKPECSGNQPAVRLGGDRR